MLRLVTTRAARHAARAVAPACNVAFQRGYAEGGDIVKDVFLNQQKQFRALLDATKDLEVPVDGDSAAIKAYAEKRKAIMQKVRRRRNAQTETRPRPDRRATGVGDPSVPGTEPSVASATTLNARKRARCWFRVSSSVRVFFLVLPVVARDRLTLTHASPPRTHLKKTQLGIMTTEERIEATLASGVEPGQSAREYLAFAAAQRAAMGLEDVSGLGKALDEALAEVEKAAGKPLMMDDAAGMKALYAKVEGAVADAGLSGDLATASMVADAENEIKHLKAELAKNK